MSLADVNSAQTNPALHKLTLRGKWHHISHTCRSSFSVSCCVSGAPCLAVPTPHVIHCNRLLGRSTSCSLFCHFFHIPVSQSPSCSALLSDLNIIAAIIAHAEDAANSRAAKSDGTSSKPPSVLPHSHHLTFLSILQSHDEVLPQFGLSPDSDLCIYHLLLLLNLDPDPLWWRKLEKQCQHLQV